MDNLNVKMNATRTAQRDLGFARTGVSCFFLFLLLLLSVSSRAQEVKASVDTASIRIGEQVTYSIAVETEAEDLVVFPEGQTFTPLEMVESFSVDTTRVDNRLQFLKKYALTQFDSGSYTIPRQQIQINDRTLFTDSIPIEVATVVVDTTKQKLYPIKPAVEVSAPISFPSWGWWLLALLVLGILIALFFRRKKKKEAAAAKLPPYEQAISDLHQLDDSLLLEQREIKEYYSQLTAAVRRYLDGEIYDHAMESTTNELIQHIEVERKAGKLNVDDSTIDRLKEILQRADLAKFANNRPDIITAREDRSKAEGIINDTKEGIPQPTEEEMLQDQLYQEKLEKRKKRKKIIIGVIAVILAFGAFTAYMVSTKGFTYVKDTYFGHPTKELLEGEWIRSAYGTPAVNITTPEVLKRGEVDIPQEARAAMVGNETFLYGSLLGDYFVSVTTLQFNQNTEFDLKAAVDGVYEYLESKGARNILMKEEDFTTVNGATGKRIFGKLNIQDPVTEEMQEKSYAILNFAEGGGFQQITLIYNSDDSYAEEITQRIVTSVELKDAGN